MKTGNKSTAKHVHSLGGGLRVLTASALLVALSIVTGNYLAFNLGPVLRFSLENLPILLAGIVLGPVTGALVGAAADLLGCVLVGYTINPLITLGAVAVGLLGGLLCRLCSALPLSLQIAVTVTGAHLIGSVLIKTLGLSIFYDMPLVILMLWRALNYLIVGCVEGILLYFLLKNQALRRLLNGIRG